MRAGDGWKKTQSARIGKTLQAFGAEFTQRVLLHGAPAYLVKVPALVRELMEGGASATGKDNLTEMALHQVFMVMNAAIRMLLFEYDAAIGECFMAAKMQVEVAEYFGKDGKQIMAEPEKHPRTGELMEPLPLAQFKTVETAYMLRVKADNSVKRTRNDYETLFAASDTDFFTEIGGQDHTLLPPLDASERLTYPERKRFHNDVRLAFHAFLLDHTHRSEMLEKTPDQSAIHRLRCFEYLIQKLMLVRHWAMGFRHDGFIVDTATRFVCMNSSVADAAPGFLIEQLHCVDGSRAQRETVHTWAKSQRKMDEDIAKEDAIGAAEAADEAVLGEMVAIKIGDGTATGAAHGLPAAPAPLPRKARTKRSGGWGVEEEVAGKVASVAATTGGGETPIRRMATAAKKKKR